MRQRYTRRTGKRARSRYEPEDVAVLKGEWLAAGQPCARLLAREDLGREHRRKLHRLLKNNDPIEMRARVEAKLKALYELRARLMSEDEEQAPKVTPVREVITPAVGSNAGEVADHSKVEEPLPMASSCPKKTSPTVASTVRHHE